MHEFLSPEWMTAVEEIRERYRDATPELPVAVTVNVKVDDAPDSVASTEFHIDTRDGTFTVNEGQVENADVEVSAEYRIIRSLVVDGDGEELMRAFLEGQVLIQGDMARLLVLQASIAQHADTQAAGEVADAIRDVTS